VSDVPGRISKVKLVIPGMVDVKLDDEPLMFAYSEEVKNLTSFTLFIQELNLPDILP
jgi:hypothetical protein